MLVAYADDAGTNAEGHDGDDRDALVMTRDAGGERRRLSLCCGTITDPDLLFADEPTSGAPSTHASTTAILTNSHSSIASPSLTK